VLGARTARTGSRDPAPASGARPRVVLGEVVDHHDLPGDGGVQAGSRSWPYRISSTCRARLPLATVVAPRSPQGRSARRVTRRDLDGEGGELPEDVGDVLGGQPPAVCKVAHPTD
jgi:hypothetical protein